VAQGESSGNTFGYMEGGPPASFGVPRTSRFSVSIR